MSAKGFMINGTNYYDAWSPAAREQFYAYSKEAMFDIGVAALWLDAESPRANGPTGRVCRRAPEGPMIDDSAESCDPKISGHQICAKLKSET